LLDHLLYWPSRMEVSRKFHRECSSQPSCPYFCLHEGTEAACGVRIAVEIGIK
jgi:hypothetical protein